MNNIGDQPYVRLTTFTKDGRAKPTPVWIVCLSPTLMGTTTDDDSWKVKRIRHSSTVELAPSDGKGQVSADAKSLSGSAKIIDNTHDDYKRLDEACLEKYGWQYRIFRFIRKLRGKTACGIEIELG